MSGLGSLLLIGLASRSATSHARGQGHQAANTTIPRSRIDGEK
jgi:hypothetical protein